MAFRGISEPCNVYLNLNENPRANPCIPLDDQLVDQIKAATDRIIDKCTSRDNTYLEQIKVGGSIDTGPNNVVSIKIQRTLRPGANANSSLLGEDENVQNI